MHNLNKIDTIIFSSFSDRKFHLIAGALALPKSARFISSVPYLQDDIAWCVSSAKPVPRWRAVFLFVKDYKVYVCGAILAICALIVVYFFLSLDKQPMNVWTCGLICFATVIGMSAPVQARTSIVRFFHGCILMGTTVIYTTIIAFCTMFASNIIFLKQINTINELIDAQFNLTGDASVLGHLTNRNLVRTHDLIIS